MSDVSSETETSLPWRPGRGIAVAIAAFLAGQLLASLFLSLYPVLRHWNAAQTNAWLNNSTLGQFFYVVLSEFLIVGFVYLFLRRKPGALSAIGLRRPRWLDPLLGLAGLPLYLLIFFVAINITGALVPHLNVNQKQQLGFNSVHGFTQLGLTFIALVVLPPIAEEVVFRGLIYSSFKKLFSLWPAVILTSALFAAGHLPEGGSGGPLYIAAIDTFSLSLVLILLREKTNSLWASITLHALKNGIAFISLFALHLN